MPDPITARLDDLETVEPPAVVLARALLARAQSDLHEHLRRRSPQDVIDAHRYAVQRRHDQLEQAWHDAARSVAR